MALPSPTRKALLTVHIVSSVGWVGAVLAYLALGVAAVTSADTDLVRAAYLVMNWAAWVVLVPLAVTSLVSGTVQSLTTPWGLLRHYWVVFKLVITVVATVILIAYTGTLDAFAQVASREPLTPADLHVLRSPSVVVHSTGALLLLLSATVLAVYKPVGLTRHGQRFRQRQRATT